MIADQTIALAGQVPGLVALHDREVVISVRSVGKMYRIYEKPQDRLKQMLLWRYGKNYGREFWALRDVSFEVHKGDAVGIIGRNGSGKSTLLQLIAGTLAPTEGDVNVRGRVAALLELGSGFNPEFTGQENVFMNGAILGVDRPTMESRFDEIAAFADIGDFINQPVKIYSSGMLVRLAFAVQVFLEPDVLIVDEALSVGDAYFQHKCMRRIKELIDQGTTLLFVSHSTETVKRFCQRGLWIDSGVVKAWGESGLVVEKYMAFMRMREVQDILSDAQKSADSSVEPVSEVSTAPDDTAAVATVDVQQDWSVSGTALVFRRDPLLGKRYADAERYGTKKVLLTAIELLDYTSGQLVTETHYGQRVRLRLHAERLTTAGPRIEFSYIVRDRNRIDLFGTTTFDENVTLNIQATHFVVEFAFDIQLGPGSYSILSAAVECSEDMQFKSPMDCIDISYVFTVNFDHTRPVWYMFHEPVAIQVLSE